MRHSWRIYAPLMACASAATAFALVRCGDDSSACDACADVTLTPLTVALTPAEIWIHPSDAKPVAVALARGPGGAGDVVVTIETDAGFTADPLTIADGKTDGTLVVHVPPSFTQGETTLTVDAQTPTTLAQAPLIVHVAGASGTLDTSFGAAGVADLDPGAGQEFARAMIVLQSGVLVGVTHVEAASSMKVLRLTAAGAIDSSFATTTTAGDLAALAMLPDGRVFAAGDVTSATSDFAVVRIGAAGGVDPTYAVSTPIPSGDVAARAAIVQPGGLLVAAGTSSQSTTLARWTQAPLPPDAGVDASDDSASDASADAIVDATSDATDADASPNTAHLDPNFGDAGVVFGSDQGTNVGALLVANDGSLYAVAGRTSLAGALALHFASNGALDTTFGDGGTALVTTSDIGAPTSALLEPSGDIVIVSGTSLFRLSPSGAVAQTVTLPNNAWTALARDPASGAIYVGGTIGATCQVMRLTSALQVDTTFGVGWFAKGLCTVAALGVDDDGKIVALATIMTGAAVSRYWP